MFIPMWLMIVVVILAIPVVILAVTFLGFLISMVKNSPWG
jgi:hypothetical protein